MSFHRLVLLSLVPGCALIDATGTAKAVVGEYHGGNIPASAAPRMAVVADLDGMPGIDVVVLDDSGSVETALAQGDTAMYAVKQTQMMGYTTIAAADLGESPFFEVIAAGPGKLDILRPSGDGMVSRTPLTVPGNFMPAKIAVGKIMGSAMPAIAVSSGNSGQVFVYTNPLGTPVMTTVTVAETPDDIAIGDVDSSVPGDELIVAVGQNIATFAGATMMRRDTGLRMGTGRATHIAAGSLGSSDEADVAYLHVFQGPAEVDILFGSPTGLFDATGGFASGDVGDALIAADLDGNGTSDLAMIYGDNTGKRHVVTLRSASATASASFTQDDFTVEGNPQTLAAADLDGDGLADFLLAPGARGGVDLLLSR